MSKPEIIIIRESVVASVLKDIGTFGCLVAAIGIGVWIDSPALQWVAGFVWCVLLVGAGMKYIYGAPRFTISDARKRLDELDEPSTTLTNGEA